MRDTWNQAARELGAVQTNWSFKNMQCSFSSIWVAHLQCAAFQDRLSKSFEKHRRQKLPHLNKRESEDNYWAKLAATTEIKMIGHNKTHSGFSVFNVYVLYCRNNYRIFTGLRLMEARCAIFLRLHVDCIKGRRELHEMYAGHPLFNSLNEHLADLHFSTILHFMDCRVHSRFYRSNRWLKIDEEKPKQIENIFQAHPTRSLREVWAVVEVYHTTFWHFTQ